jgi:hypothetical protein
MPFAARLDYSGLLDLWIENRPRITAWWTLAREWPTFKTGFRDLIPEDEFSEMRAQGPKIAGDVAEIIAEVRRNTAHGCALTCLLVDCQRAGLGHRDGLTMPVTSPVHFASLSNCCAAANRRLESFISVQPSHNGISIVTVWHH